MHHRPSPRLHAGPALASVGARCGIDISDGIAREPGHLAKRISIRWGGDGAARASNVAIVIDIDAVAFHPDAVAMFGLQRACTCGLTVGEDYELLVALPQSPVDRARDAIASETTLAVIGCAVHAQPGGLVTATSGGMPFTLGADGYVAFPGEDTAIRPTAGVNGEQIGPVSYASCDGHLIPQCGQDRVRARPIGRIAGKLGTIRASPPHVVSRHRNRAGFGKALGRFGATFNTHP